MTTPWAGLERRAKWMALPEGERWVTVLLDLDEVMCVGQPYAGTDLLKSFELGCRHDQRQINPLFSSEAIGALMRVHEELARPFRFAISSSWREHFSRDQLELIFRSAGLEFVADNLHDGAAWRCPSAIPSGPYQCWSAPTRAEEIKVWLRYFHADEPFVALDDDASGHSLAPDKLAPDHKLVGRVVLCQPGTGLIMEHVDDILAALRRPA
jgi:hypothetical protein